jgi:hypothetical protein
VPTAAARGALRKPVGCSLVVRSLPFSINHSALLAYHKTLSVKAD